MALPQQFLEALRANLPVSEIVGRRVKLTRRGNEYTGLCPFHNEKTPSFTVNDEKAFYHCFGCGAHGDIVSFVMQTEGDGFVEAARRLAEEAGMALPSVTPQQRAADDRRLESLQILENASRWYQGQLETPAGRPAREYLATRGFLRPTIEAFQIGYAPASRDLFATAMAAAGASESDLIGVGLLKQPETGGRPRAYFFDRIIIPIADARARIIGFGGRALGDRQPKYLNSPDNPLFHKGEVLYNEARAKAAARSAGTLLVVEGYTDVIALHQGGLSHAVAPLGTAVTERQLARLWKHADEPVLCFDGDSAGQRAALRAAERALPLLSAGKSLRFVSPPDGEDPDSLISRRGPQAVEAMVGHARPLVDLLWRAETHGRNLETPERRAALEKRLQEKVEAITDPQVRWQYQTEFRQRIRNTRTGPQGGRRRTRQPPRTRQEAAATLPTRGDVDAAQAGQEAALLALLINQPWLLDHRAEDLNELQLRTPLHNRMLQRIREFFALTQELDTAALERHLIATGLEEGLRTVLSPTVYRQASFAAPGGAPEEAAKALDDILVWRSQEKLRADRVAAEQDLAQAWNDSNDTRLLRIVREEVGGG